MYGNELRPDNFSGIVGQQEAIEVMKIAISSSIKRNDAIPHTLFEAGPGLGKTTFAMAIAKERGVPVQILNAANTRQQVLIDVLMNVRKHEVIFIDEIHRMTDKMEEILYPVMEDFRLDIATKEYQSVSLPRFTLIGATTNSGDISRPMYDRFEYKVQLTNYNINELSQILAKGAESLGVDITQDALYNIARRGRGTPRVVNSLLKRCRDYAYATSSRSINGIVVDKVMELAGIDDWGLTRQDRKYLNKLKEIHGTTGRAVALRTLTAATGIDEGIVTEVIEPYLIQLGVLIKTARGRLLSDIIKL